MTLPSEAWDGVEAPLGHLAQITGGLLARVVGALGWESELGVAGGDTFTGARLRLADFVADPQAALGVAATDGGERCRARRARGAG